jgi:hypothetical protein
MRAIRFWKCSLRLPCPSWFWGWWARASISTRKRPKRAASRSMRPNSRELFCSVSGTISAMWSPSSRQNQPRIPPHLRPAIPVKAAPRARPEPRALPALQARRRRPAPRRSPAGSTARPEQSRWRLPGVREQAWCRSRLIPATPANLPGSAMFAWSPTASGHRSPAICRRNPHPRLRAAGSTATSKIEPSFTTARKTARRPRAIRQRNCWPKRWST